jgi:hypothetical protein
LIRIQGKSGSCGDSGRQDVGGLAQQFDVHPNQITAWKRQLSEGVSDIFDKSPVQPEVDLKALHAKIGQLTLEDDFFRERAHQGGIAERKAIICSSSDLI